jgi:hypothetical protein
MTLLAAQVRGVVHDGRGVDASLSAGRRNLEAEIAAVFGLAAIQALRRSASILKAPAPATAK